ncbi:MAG: hypothetical protein J4F34_01260 [Gemmatimonadetes bacterium]|nr:hypothetical protein [Gemmatimonadota bacterium]
MVNVEDGPEAATSGRHSHRGTGLDVRAEESSATARLISLSLRSGIPITAVRDRIRWRPRAI